MLETLIINYLISRDIEGIGEHVYAETPENAPDEYIRVEKTGSGKTDGINRAMIAVQSISRDRDHGLETVIRINEDVKEAMEQFPFMSDDIYSCKLNSDYNFTDTQSKEYRYQAVFNLFY